MSVRIADAWPPTFHFGPVMVSDYIDTVTVQFSREMVDDRLPVRVGSLKELGDLAHDFWPLDEKAFTKGSVVASLGDLHKRFGPIEMVHSRDEDGSVTWRRLDTSEPIMDLLIGYTDRELAGDVPAEDVNHLCFTGAITLAEARERFSEGQVRGIVDMLRQVAMEEAGAVILNGLGRERAHVSLMDVSPGVWVTELNNEADEDDAVALRFINLKIEMEKRGLPTDWDGLVDRGFMIGEAAQ